MHHSFLMPSGAKLRIMKAAEALFADHGFESVSIRKITAAAPANVAAVNYHFGSREGLVTAVICRFLNEVDQERSARLAGIPAAERSRPPEEILGAFVWPLVDLLARSETYRKLFLKLESRAAREDALPAPALIQEERTMDTFINALHDASPAAPREKLTQMLRRIAGDLRQLLKETLQQADGSPANEDLRHRTERFIRFEAESLKMDQTA